MIRVISITSLTLLLALVLYLPSAHAPQHFIAQLRADHAQLTAFWGPAYADQVLSRTIEIQALTQGLAPLQQHPRAEPADSAVGSEMSAVTARLFSNSYFRSVEALILLATHRFFVLLEWMPWLALFGMAAMIDAIAARSVKAKALAHHNPEAFAACFAGAILTVCGALVALVVPIPVPVTLFPALHVAFVLLVTGSMRHYHRRA